LPASFVWRALGAGWRVKAEKKGGLKPKEGAGKGLNRIKGRPGYLNPAFLTIIRMPDYNESGIFTGVL